MIPSTNRRLTAIYNCILNYIYNRGFHDYDDFALELASEVLSQLEQGRFRLKLAIKRINSGFFEYNEISRRKFFDQVLEAQIVEIWRVIKIQSEKVQIQTTSNETQSLDLIEVPVDNIDSFSKVRSIPPESVSKNIPLAVLEKTIKDSIAQIIGEKYVDKDWGGEDSDLHTTRLKFKGKRIRAAFLLKGRGTEGKLTISKCGKNGDQILRLSKQEARMYIIQHVDKITPQVTETLVSHLKNRGYSGDIYYCIIDGVDTARLLIAYKILTRK